MAIYQIGQLVRLAAAFTDEDDVAVDPTTVTVTITNPSGTDTAYVYGTDAEVVKDSIGNYHVDYEVDENGLWTHRWVSTGTIAALKAYFEVNALSTPVKYD
jgi:hypothetical protein